MRSKQLYLILGSHFLYFLFSTSCYGQQSFWEKIEKQPATLGIDKGSESFTLQSLALTLLKTSQTVSGLKLHDDSVFDFTPDELLPKRDRNSFYHLGDINLAVRQSDNDQWHFYSSAKHRQPVSPLTTFNTQLAKADLSNTLDGIPLQVIRTWENHNGDLVLRFEIKNTTHKTYEIGDLGVPMIFNNHMDAKSLDSAHHDNVFFDPYIGCDAGYLQVNRLHGLGPSLLILPLEGTGFEAYNPLNDDPTPRSITFEGFHEWMIHSKATAQTAWQNAVPWNIPTSTLLKPGASKSIGFRFVLAPSIKAKEDVLIQQHKPVAIGAPGYIVPMDAPAKLFIHYHKAISKITVSPANALSLKKMSPTKNGWMAYELTGQHWGRARLTIHYSDGLQQTVHYKVIKSEVEVVKDLGHFLTNKQWFNERNDPFGRAPSIMTYDNETQQLVKQEQRAWFAGLSDEAGAASWLAALMKQILIPDPQEIEKIRLFMKETLFGKIQLASGKDKYGVVKSLFYYEPDSMPMGTYIDTINFKTWAAWPKKEAMDLGRSYNYPHVAAAHWVFYCLAKNYPTLVPDETWRTYLDRAFETTMAMVEKAPYYAQFGQMEGSIFLILLNDLRKEGFSDHANRLEAAMRKRAEHWRGLPYPFGSEMPWDSTGQEEVYLWSKFFGFDDKALVTLNAILAYTPVLPHWGYNGSARRYWDFVYGGKLSRIERQLHHYGSALNAIPLLTDYRDHPDDFYLLRVGHAAMMGALANVTAEGFGPAAFHSYPATLTIDGMTGDYGCGFYGYAINSGTYIYKHPEFGWLAFSGTLTEDQNNISVKIKTAGKSRVYLAEEKLWITLEAGQLDRLSYNKTNRSIRLYFDRSPLQAAAFKLSIDAKNPYKVVGYDANPSATYTIPSQVETIVLSPAPYNSIKD